MGDYNPRQITQMRWKDAKTLEHLIFKAIDISFNDNSSVKLSGSLEARQLVNRIEYCYNNQVPLIIYEYANDRIFIATNFGSATEVYLSCINSGVESRLGLTYDGQDTLSMTLADTIFLTAADAPKMYRHELFINSATFIIYSTNQLKINNTQDLTTVVKPDGFSTFVGAIYSSDLPVLTVVLYYDNGTWKINDGSVSNVTTIKDTVVEA